MSEAQLKLNSHRPIHNLYKTIYGPVRSVCSAGCERDRVGINSTHLILDIEENLIYELLGNQIYTI